MGDEDLPGLAWLFEGRITLTTGKITIQWISVNKTNRAIHWIVIYPEKSDIDLMNNPSQRNNVRDSIKIEKQRLTFLINSS